ncbi:hypothetical protein CPC08DRAFT_767350 [Agrocybe pediades]|nr:hypothetical protein CPC08DRAFT_767350 [Agrocybe pediades]
MSAEEGNIVPPATNSRSKKKRAETDEDMEENEQEDEMPPSKKRQTKVKSAEFVEASDDGNPMDVDVPQGPSQPPPSRAGPEVRHVSWAASVAKDSQHSSVLEPHRPGPLPANQPSAASASVSIPRPITPLIVQLPGVNPIPRISAANDDDPAIGHTLWGSVPRLPVQIPREHFIEASKLPPNADMQTLTANQARADEALFSFIPRQADIVRFLEEVQVERHEHMQLLAKQELDLQAWQNSTDGRQSVVEATIADLENRLAAVEPKTSGLVALEERVDSLHEDNRHDRRYLDAAFKRIEDLEDEVDRRIEANKEACQRLEALESLTKCHHQTLEVLSQEFDNVDPMVSRMALLEYQVSQLLACTTNIPQSPPPHPESAAPSAAPTPYVQDDGSDDESAGPIRPMHTLEDGNDDGDEDMVDVEESRESSLRQSPQPSLQSPRELSAGPDHTDMPTQSTAAADSPQPTLPPGVVFPGTSLESANDTMVEVNLFPPTPLKTLIANMQGESANTSGMDSPPPAPAAPTLLVPPTSRHRAESISTRSRSTSVVTRSRAGSATRRSPRLHPQVEEGETLDGGLA